MTLTARSALLVTGLAVGVTVLAGCTTGTAGSSSSSSPTPSSPASTATASASGAAPTSAAPSSAAPSSAAPTSAAPSSAAPTSAAPSGPASSSATSPGPARCTTADVKTTVSGGGGAAGSLYYKLRITNTSTHTCRTGGFSGVSFVGRAGKQIGSPADRARPGSVVPLLLRPHAVAVSTLVVVNAANFPAARCAPVQARGLRVYPPNDTRADFVPLRVTACSRAAVHQASLTPYRAG